MKKLLKALGITIALTAFGVGVRAIKKKISITQRANN